MVDGRSPLGLRAQGLVKRYARVQALDGFDLEVPAGTVVGLLGPNGAGKTTAVRVFATLVRPDAGHAEVAGWDVVRHGDQVRARIGLVGQHAAVDEELSGRQNLELFARLAHLPRRAGTTRATELLARFDLQDTGDLAVKRYSGGMRRRLDLAVSLLLAPPVLFLDEPTTGLDPRGRTEVWAAIRALVREGTTVLLTTQQLDEADQLADRVSVVDGGRVIAGGTPDELKALVGGDRLEVVVRDAGRLADCARILESVSHSPVEQDPDARRVSAPIHHRVAALVEALGALEAGAVVIDDIALPRPTLDDAFLHLTGRRATATQAAGTAPGSPAAAPEEVAA